MQTLSVVEALTRVATHGLLEAVALTESLSLRDVAVENEIDLQLTFRDCMFTTIDAACITFYAPVTFERCRVQQGLFFATYFVGGTRFQDCLFEEVSFQCGGHNAPSASFILEGCTFRSFVNFFNGWYSGPVEVRSCRFEGWTNLLGNQENPGAVLFEIEPMVKGNEGLLNVDDG